MLLHEAGVGTTALLQHQGASVDAGGRRARRHRREVGPDDGLSTQEERRHEQKGHGQETKAAPILDGLT
jgi:hypothetical protein